ncbi:MAG: endonuclease [Bacilli bacterium]
MKSKTIVSLMFLGLILSACGPNPSESSEPTSQPGTSDPVSEPVSETPTTSEEPVTSSPATSEDPIISPTINLTIAPEYTGTFWSGLNLTLTGQALRDHLNQYMWARFTKIDYNTVSTAVLEMDQDPNNSANILSLYDLNPIAKNRQNYSWNREHTFPQSKLADGDDSLRAGPSTKNISSDAANIFAADNDLNTTRSNFSFIDLDLEEKYETYTIYNSFGTRTDNFIYRGYFAPTQKVRGEIARAQLYMLVMYPDNCSMNENFSLADMLRWNMEFAPTVERDMQRNAGLEKYQTLRNPFIDNPDLGCQVFGDINASTRSACGIS